MMINRIQLLRNVGQFDSVSTAATIPLARLTFIYAENGRGKTTLSAIFRSLATGDPVHIAERRRLTAQHDPHVVIDCDGGPPAAMFQNNAWNRTLPNVAVFDDLFIDENVYSGLVVSPDHRQNLHELILGARGVALVGQLQQLVAQIEVHNTALRTKAAAIPSAERGALSAEEFCGLQPRPNIDEEIVAAERGLAAVREHDPIRNTPTFDALVLPAFDLAPIEVVLQQDLPALDTATAARVQAHLAGAHQGAEAWVAEGMRHLPHTDEGQPAGTCPFCAQDLARSPVIAHYRAYFSEEYRNLKRSVAEVLNGVERTHGGEVIAGLERAIRVAGERRQFWSRFCDTPNTAMDTAPIARAWQAARSAVVDTLRKKQAAPLDRMNLSGEARSALGTYDAHRLAVAELSQQLQRANAAIRVVKEQAASGNAAALSADVTRLKAVKARYAPESVRACNAYLDEKASKAATEQLRDSAKSALDQYRATAFPGYQTAINRYI